MLERKSLGEADDVVTFPKGRVEIVNLPGLVLGRAIFEPGWRWSESVKPIVKTASCRNAHAGLILSGRMHVRMDDGTEIDLAAGDAHVASPGHDAWVLGDDPLVAVDVITSGGMGTTALTAGCPCGVTFSVESTDAIDHLVAAVQEHALHSHGQSVMPAQILADVKRPGSVAAAGQPPGPEPF
jgi:hypothetical protein